VIFSERAIDIDAAAADGEPATAIAFDLEGARCRHEHAADRIGEGRAEAAASNFALLVPILVEKGAPLLLQDAAIIAPRVEGKTAVVSVQLSLPGE
jgi:hypothetical protein